MSDIVARLRKAARLEGDLETLDQTLLIEIQWLLRAAADRIEYLESVAGAVSQAPEASPFAKRQRNG